jgi:hypothetical protein
MGRLSMWNGTVVSQLGRDAGETIRQDRVVQYLTETTKLSPRMIELVANQALNHLMDVIRVAQEFNLIARSFNVEEAVRMGLVCLSVTTHAAPAQPAEQLLERVVGDEIQTASLVVSLEKTEFEHCYGISPAELDISGTL